MSCPGDYSGGPGYLAGILQCADIDVLYYTEDCPVVGMWGREVCLPCPVGGLCPGGFRVWALPGFWNPAEQYVPYSCLPAQACPGSTRYPRCSEGYEDQYCSRCAEGFYRSGQACVSCSEASPPRFVPVVISAIVFFGTIALAAVALNDNKLDMLVGLLLSAQQVILIGNQASVYISPEAQRLFSSVMWVLFDYTWVNPGCYIPSISYVQVWGGTIVSMLVFLALFACAALLRALLMRRLVGDSNGMVNMAAKLPKPTKETKIHTKLKLKILAIMIETEDDHDNTPSRLSVIRKDNEKTIPWFVVFKRRLVRCWVVLLSLIYLIVTTRTLQGLYCIEINGSSRLYVERSTTCYQGDHLASYPFLLLVFILYSVGFLAFCIYIVLLSHRQHTTEKKKTMKGLSRMNSMIGFMTPAFADMFGFLWRDLRFDYIWFRMIPFGLSLFIAFQQAFGMGVPLQLLLNVITFVVYLGGVAWLWPFQKMFSNVMFMITGIARAFIVLILLRSLRPDALRAGGESVYFWIGLAFFLAFVITSIIIRLLKMRKERKGPFAPKNNTKKDIELQNNKNTFKNNEEEESGNSSPSLITVELSSNMTMERHTPPSPSPSSSLSELVSSTSNPLPTSFPTSPATSSPSSSIKHTKTNDDDDEKDLPSSPSSSRRHHHHHNRHERSPGGDDRSSHHRRHRQRSPRDDDDDAQDGHEHDSRRKHHHHHRSSSASRRSRINEQDDDKGEDEPSHFVPSPSRERRHDSSRSKSPKHHRRAAEGGRERSRRDRDRDRHVDTPPQHI
eukprot:TRINITY_DN3509_c0_g1_i6.p1 TRINITY_DN3509_c0_g1~~TRINITY_DN3509_c0_g1_i6.p1  ORF type:complete len:786 (+),score=89.53 TRINITY_DN3509_c0_g1_i6:1646-4003(+)